MSNKNDTIYKYFKVRLDENNAKDFVYLASQIDGDVNLYSDNKHSIVVDGKSLLGVLSLDMSSLICVELIARYGDGVLDLERFCSENSIHHNLNYVKIEDQLKKDIGTDLEKFAHDGECVYGVHSDMPRVKFVEVNTCGKTEDEVIREFEEEWYEAMKEYDVSLDFYKQGMQYGWD